MDGSIQVVNRALCELVGRDETWFQLHRLDEVIHPDDIQATIRARERFLEGSSDQSAGGVRLLRSDGATVWVRRVAVLIRGEDGKPNLLMVQFDNFTAEHHAQEALAYQAFHDPLTGLHNRAWVMDILTADLRAARLVGASVGTLFVDLDKFNVVNDSLGHEAGDEVLTTVAERIVAVIGDERLDAPGCHQAHVK